MDTGGMMIGHDENIQSWTWRPRHRIGHLVSSGGGSEAERHHRMHTIYRMTKSKRLNGHDLELFVSCGFPDVLYDLSSITLVLVADYQYTF